MIALRDFLIMFLGGNYMLTGINLLKASFGLQTLTCLMIVAEVPKDLIFDYYSKLDKNLQKVITQHDSFEDFYKLCLNVVSSSEDDIQALKNEKLRKELENNA